MSSYYEIMKRIRPAGVADEPLSRTIDLNIDQAEAEEQVTGALAEIPQVENKAAISPEVIQRLSERLAPLAVLESPVRLLVSGCRPGDGASTVASALALDLSQRLGLRILLVDAHLRNPSLHRIVANRPAKGTELVLAGSVQTRPTDWPRLDLATCAFSAGDTHQGPLWSELEITLGRYPAVVVDLGVTRLDPRMLPLARPTDPILLVVRYGHTERDELLTTTAGLRASNRTIAGVILNAVKNPISQPLPGLIRRTRSIWRRKP